MRFIKCILTKFFFSFLIVLVVLKRTISMGENLVKTFKYLHTTRRKGRFTLLLSLRPVSWLLLLFWVQLLSLGRRPSLGLQLSWVLRRLLAWQLPWA